MVICGVHSSFAGASASAPLRAVTHRLFQHLLVKLDADLADMARLFVAQQIAGAADIEIVARKREAGAQRVEGLHHFEPALRGLGQHLARRQGQIGIGAQLAAADAAAQLIELRQAEHVGAMDDHRIGGRNVEAGFDDVGREQQIVLRRRRRRSSRLRARSGAIWPWAIAILISGTSSVSCRLRPRRGRRCAARRRSSARRDNARAGSPRAPPPDR